MILLATILLLAVLCVVFCLRPMWGLYAVVALMPFEWIGSWALNSHTGHPVINLAEVAAVAWLVGLAFEYVVHRPKYNRPAWPWWWLLAFMAWAAISAAHIGHVDVLASYVIVVLLFCVTTAMAAVADRIDKDTFMATLLASAAAVCLFGIYQFVMGTFRNLKWAFLRAPYIRDLFGFPRIHSVTFEPLYFANYLLIPLLIGLTYLLVAPKLLRGWQKATVALAALDFLLTMSRGAILALVPALVVLAIGLMRLKGVTVKWKPVILGGVAIVALGAVSIGAASAIATGNPVRGIDNFASELTVKLFSTGSFYQREGQSGIGLSIARSHPIFGVALEGVTPYVNGYNAPRHPNDVIALNNQAVELLAETGVVGTILFYIFVLSLLWVAWQAYPRVKDLGHRALLLGSIVTLVAMTLQAQSFTGFFLMVYWVIYGLVLAMSAYGVRAAKLAKTA